MCVDPSIHLIHSIRTSFEEFGKSIQVNFTFKHIMKTFLAESIERGIQFVINPVLFSFASSFIGVAVLFFSPIGFYRQFAIICLSPFSWQEEMDVGMTVTNLTFLGILCVEQD